MRLMGGRTRRHARRGIAGGSCVNRACLSVCLSLRGSALRLVSFSWVPCLGARPPLAGRDLGGCFLFVLAGSFVHFFGPSGCPHRRPRCFRSAAFFCAILFPFEFTLPIFFWTMPGSHGLFMWVCRGPRHGATHTYKKGGKADRQRQRQRQESTDRGAPPPPPQPTIAGQGGRTGPQTRQHAQAQRTAHEREKQREPVRAHARI